MSTCQCGGWIGSGDVDMYAGRYCRCAGPMVAQVFESTSLNLDYERMLKHLGETEQKTLDQLHAQLTAAREIIKKLEAVAEWVECECRRGYRCEKHGALATVAEMKKKAGL